MYWHSVLVNSNAWAVLEWGQELWTQLENHMLLYISLEILVRTSIEQQLDPIVSQGRSVRLCETYC